MKIDRLVCVGLSHQTAPVELREQLSQWSVADLRTAAIEEIVLLSTCNRLELYAYVAETEAGTAATQQDGEIYQPLLDLIATTQSLSPSTFVEHLYFHRGEAVVHHLCRVAAGLESLVMGEGQILGQVRTALQNAYAAKSVGPALALLFHTGIRAGKRARTETKISTNAVSVSSAAVALAGQLVGDLRHKKVALIGLGEMGQLALKSVQARGADVTLMNRTQAKAERLAEASDAIAAPWAMLPAVLQRVDVVLLATGASEPVITADLVGSAMTARAGRPMLLLDLGVPRNVETAVATLPNVQLRDVDDLRAAVDEALATRRAQVPLVDAIIGEMLADWRQAWHELRLRPVVVALRQQAEETRQRMVERTLRHLEQQQGPVDAAVAEQLRYLSQALVNQLLHEPTVRLKAHAAEADGAQYAALARELFALDVDLPADLPDSTALVGETARERSSRSSNGCRRSCCL